MIRPLNYCCFLFFLLFVATQVSAQTKADPEVEVDLGSGTFLSTTPLPFDVPFKIKGTITSDVREIDVKYRIKTDAFKPWMRFPSSVQGKWSDSVVWKNVDIAPSDNKFRLLVGPLHPDVKYEFKFEVYKTTTISDPEKLILTQQISKALLDFINDPANITNTNFDQLNQDLEKKIKAATGKLIVRFRNPDGSDFRFNMLREPLKTITGKLRKDHNVIKNANTVLSGCADFFTSNMFLPVGNILKGINPANLNAAGTTLFNQVIDANIAGLNTLKVKDVIKLMNDNADLGAQVILAKKKITGGALVVADAYDAPTSDLLISFFKLLKSGNFQGADNADLFKDQAVNINTALDQLTKAGKSQADIAVAVADQKLINLPDLLNGLEVQEAYDFYDESTSDAVSQNTPYIGLDFGFVSLPTYGQIFIYEGANFYMVPVNKDAPLASFHGFWNSISKRVSVHLGITQGLISAQDKRYAPLIDNVGSVLVGAGIRVNRIMRVNGGEMFFWQSNLNPLITQKVLANKFAISMTFDINVAKALGSLGTKLGL